MTLSPADIRYAEDLAAEWINDPIGLEPCDLGYDDKAGPVAVMSEVLAEDEAIIEHALALWMEWFNSKAVA